MRRALRFALRFVLVAFVVGTGLSYLNSLPPGDSVAWERSGSGHVTVTGGSWLPTVSARYVHSASESTRSLSAVDLDRIVEQPLRLSSFTIVGLGERPLAQRIAVEVAGEAQSLDGVRRVDVRTPGQAPEDDRLGDQILVFEVLRASASPMSRWSPVSSFSAVVDGWVGHVPEFGWGEDLDMRQQKTADWSLDVSARVVGLPFSGPGGLADRVAGTFDLGAYVEDLVEGVERVAPFPPELVAERTDLGNSGDAVRAMGIEEPPVYAGRRHLRKGEALWRYEGPGAEDRLEAAIAALRSAGWKEGAGMSSAGADGRTHLSTLRRGDEFVRLQYHENRVGRFQQVSYTSQWTPEGGSTPQVKHVEGEPIDPVVWLYYRHEASTEELRALHARAKALGAGALVAFEANLPWTRRVDLGLVPAEAASTED